MWPLRVYGGGVLIFFVMCFCSVRLFFAVERLKGKAKRHEAHVYASVEIRGNGDLVLQG